MSVQSTLTKLDLLGLKGMKAALQRQMELPAHNDLTFEQRVGMLVDEEESFRLNARRDRLLKAAKLRVIALPEDKTYGPERLANKELILRLLTSDWIGRKQNALVTGKSGTGKTWLACAFGVQAAREGLSVSYRLVSRILEEFELARADGSLGRLRAKYNRFDLLILDDFGIGRLKATSKQDLLEILDDRVGDRSKIVCGQMPVANWHAFIDNDTIADAILDRLTSSAHRLELTGLSKRRKIT